MKTIPRIFTQLCLAVSFAVGLVLSGHAQTSGSGPTTIPTVYIVATQPIATVSGQQGQFTVFRAGDTNQELIVYYQIGGTASNGMDYAQIGPIVVIPAGVTSNTITIDPMNHGQTGVETVTLTLGGSPLMTPVNFIIGCPNAATVYIEGVGATNVPPYVEIVSLVNGQIFVAPTSIQLEAAAGDVDGNVTSVEFFAGTNSLGVVSNGIVIDPVKGGSCVPGDRMFILEWTNAPLGSNVLTAKATDNGGASTISSPVDILVEPPGLPPVVTIEATSPNAAEPCGTNAAVPGVFTIYRTSATNDVLRVLYNISGTASNGMDYATISNFTTIPKGAYSVDVVINPLADGPSPAAVETVDLTLLPVECPGGTGSSCYTVGQPSSAQVDIAQCNFITNRGPVVRITSPPNNSVFRAPVDIPLVAYASDPSGPILNVEFFDGNNDIGSGQGVCLAATPAGNPPTNPVCPMTNVFVLTWSNAPIGTNILTAVATDSSGVSLISPPVQVVVLPPVPPPTNRPPIISIVASDPIAIEGTNCWPRPWPASWAAAAATPITFSNLCGPKDALFSVMRAGDTNDGVTVSYGIGGTASNGVDYVTLPGVVDIPAGQRKALITIIPMDDGPPDVIKTVVLTLNTNVVAPTNSYVVGLPWRAAAIILDSAGQPPSTGTVPGGLFHVNAAGPDGAWFYVEYSSDLQHWTPICTNQVVNGSVDFVDPEAQSNATRFYRAVPEAGPPDY